MVSLGIGRNYTTLLTKLIGIHIFFGHGNNYTLTVLILRLTQLLRVSIASGQVAIEQFIVIVVAAHAIRIVLLECVRRFCYSGQRFINMFIGLLVTGTT